MERSQSRKSKLEVGQDMTDQILPPVMDFLKGSTACPNSTTNLESNTAYEGHFYLNHHSMHSMGCIIHAVPHRITYNAFLSTYPVMWSMTILNLSPHVSNLLTINSFEAEDLLKMEGEFHMHFRTISLTCGKHWN